MTTDLDPMWIRSAPVRSGTQSRQRAPVRSHRSPGTLASRARMWWEQAGEANLGTRALLQQCALLLALISLAFTVGRVFGLRETYEV